MLAPRLTVGKGLALCLISGAAACSVFDGVNESGSRGPQPSRDTGETLWLNPQVSSGGQPWLGPAAVYYLGRAHEVAALDKATGALLWQRVLPVQRGGTVGFGGVRSDRGVLYVGDERLFALDERDGTILWEFASPLGVDVGNDIPVLWNTTVLLASSNGYVFAVDALTGAERWHTSLVAAERGVRTWIGPVVGGRLLVGVTDFRAGQPKGSFAALDAESGAPLWIQALPVHLGASSPTTTLDPVGTATVAIAASADGPVYGYDLATGAQRWKLPPLPMTDPPMPDSLIRDLRELAICRDVLVVGSARSIIVAADPTTGRELWRARNDHGSPYNISCDDRSVFVVTWGDQLETFDLATGKKRWELAEQKSFGWTVTPEGDRVFGGNFRGAIAARNP